MSQPSTNPSGIRRATSAAFEEYAAGARSLAGAHAGEVSERLAAQMRTGMTGADLIERAEDLAAANDLRRASLAIAPGLAELAAALQNLTGRPVGQSGSGPTLWSLYPTLGEANRAARAVRLAAAKGMLPRLGRGEPFVAATVIAGRRPRPAVEFGDGTMGTIRPRTVHNEPGGRRNDPKGRAAEPRDTKGE